jgi:hypothetical protein
MSSDARTESDPFADPHCNDAGSFNEASTLTVGRNASLTLATDSLIVLGTRAARCVV